MPNGVLIRSLIFKMIHLKIGKPAHAFEQGVEAKGDIMLINYKQHKSIFVNNAHLQPNIAVFARMCKQSNILIQICGLRNTFTEEVIPSADIMMVY